MGFTLNRIAIVLMVLAMGRVALNGLMNGSLVAATAAAIVTAAFASNWPIGLSRPLRIAAFAVQMLAILGLAAGVILLLALTDNDWGDVPWWFWPIVAAIVFVIYKATAPGFRLLKEQL